MAGSVASASNLPKEHKQILKSVIHVNCADVERQGHGLKNIENILQAVEEAAAIEVVCHGAGISLLVTDQSKHGPHVKELKTQGVRFAACENTMKQKSLSKEELLPGVRTVPSGAVEVIKKQQEGYGYSSLEETNGLRHSDFPALQPYHDG